MTLLVAVLGLASVLAVGQGDAPGCRRSGCRTVTLAQRLPPGAPIETVGAPLHVRPVPAGFLGLSIEYYALAQYAGTDPRAPDPVFLQLVRALAGGRAPVLRIGGDSADWAWVPAAGVARPPGARITLTPRLLAVLRGITSRLGARLILDLDLEAGDPAVAAAEARAFLSTLGPARIAALEVGNEPELYHVLPWYMSRGRRILGRRAGYRLGDYLREFDAYAARLPRIALAGPSSGAPGWAGDLGGFAARASRLGMVTIHRYPLQRCSKEPGTPLFPTIPELLAPSASNGLAASVAPQVAAAHASGRAIRVDEINSVACYGAQGVSNTFASSLWALEASFAMARAGVDGLNFHTLPAAVYGLFSFRRGGGRWLAHVAPDYYGLLAFARAVPPGSRLLGTSVPRGGLRLWASAHKDAIHVVLINPGGTARTVGLRVPEAHGSAVLTFLRAPSLASRSVTLGGRSFAFQTATGVLGSGSLRPVVLLPRRGLYTVSVPGPAAAILTLTTRRGSS